MKGKHWIIFWVGTLIVSGVFWGIGWYGRTALFPVISIETTDSSLFAAVLCVMVALEITLLFLLAGVIIRRKNRRYKNIREYAENYLNRSQETVEDECREWMEKEMDRSAAVLTAFLLWLILWCGIYALCGERRGRLAVLIIAAVAGLVFYFRRLILVRQKVGQICSGKDTALNGLWCCLRLHNFGRKMETGWSPLDMNMAVCLTNLEDYRASRELADMIWNALGKKRSSGTYYVQYHFIQWRNAFALEDEEKAEAHMSCVERELARAPKNKFYIRVKERIGEIKDRRNKGTEE